MVKPKEKGSREIISVFGGSSPQPGSSAYQYAQDVGRLLAQKGFAVSTGGYSGTMSAVSQGASDAGGYVIGVTSDQIEMFRPLGPNQWVQEEIRYKTLQDRLIHLVRKNDGIIVLPGGIGTLSEMALAWSYLQVGEMAARPLVLLGSQWRDTINNFIDPKYLRQEHLQLLQFFDSPKQAVEFIVKYQTKKFKSQIRP
jgi:uncharacterized protein (TIGR00730 family)